LVLIATVVFGFGQQPAKKPEGHRADNSYQVSGQANAGKKDDQPTSPVTPSPDKASIQNNTEAATPDNHTNNTLSGRAANEDDLNIQRELAWFTGALVVVSFLQFGALIWQATLFSPNC
jgi:hypothetical protein